MASTATSSSTRRPIDGGAAASMVLLCAIWGTQQVVLKLAAPDMAPVVQLAVRSGLSAVLVLLLTAVRRERLPWGNRTFWPGLLAGVLFAAEVLLAGEGLRHTTASHMAVFLYTSPVFTALGLHWKLPAERLRPGQWAGIAVAFAGIAVAFGGRAAAHGTVAGAELLLGDALGVLAGAAWGFTTVVIRASSLSEAPPAQTLLYQLAWGFLFLLGGAALGGRLGAARFTGAALASVLYQGVVVSFASYLAWFWLLRRFLASRLSIFTFLTPLFGVTFGVLFLGEPITRAFAAGAALVLAGITLVSADGLRRRAA